MLWFYPKFFRRLRGRVSGVVALPGIAVAALWVAFIAA